jgi:hypothetical protein
VVERPALTPAAIVTLAPAMASPVAVARIVPVSVKRAGAGGGVGVGLVGDAGFEPLQDVAIAVSARSTRKPRRILGSMRRILTRPRIYHVLNRAVQRIRIFDEPGDYAAFLRVVRDVQLTPLPDDWRERVNATESERELAALRQRVRISEPYGDESWYQRQCLTPI